MSTIYSVYVFFNVVLLCYFANYKSVMHICMICVYVCRFSVAITKVIGKDLDSIVVDTEKTGKDCIQFMKDQVQYF